MASIWNTLLYQPLVNALAFLTSVVPGGDLGIAIILLTILVKILLFPLSQKAIQNQAAMNILAPEIEKIKKSGASKEEQARLTFELYRKHKANPFSGCLLQIPGLIVIFALYSVFIKGVNFDSSILYSFVHIPEKISTLFLGIIDISKQSLILAIIAAITQYYQAVFMPQPPTSSDPNSVQAAFGKSMVTNMKYVLPVMIFVLLYTDILGITLSGAVALYFITSNIFAIGQQIYVNKTEKKVLAEEARELGA